MGILRGSVYFDEFQDEESIILFEINSYDTGLRMVEMNRLDAILIPEIMGDYLLSEKDIDLQKCGLKFEGSLSYFAISKNPNTSL